MAMRRRIPWIAVLAVLFLPLPTAAQEAAVITGRVSGVSGAPVGGAVVAIPSLELSTVTNDLGNYRLVVSAEQSRGQSVPITVSLLGYEGIEATIELTPGALRRDFTVRERAISLDRIVVTGTAGNLEARAQSAAVASVNAAQINEVAPVSSAADLLQSRVAGVSVQGASGTSGTSQTIRIRGASSISLSNEPLVFIDGVRADSRSTQEFGVGGQESSRLNDIPPEDIESIEVVKGPAAATLYGADASAGVIQIITKRGRTGSRFSQSLTVEYHSLDANFDPPANFGNCSGSAVRRTTRPDGTPLTAAENPCIGQDSTMNVEVAPGDSVRVLGAIVSDNPLVRTDAFRTGAMRQVDWSGRGGGESYNYYVSLSSMNEEGTLPNNEYGRLGGQMSFDFLPRRDLRLEGGLGITKVDTQLPQNDNNIYGYLGGGLLGNPTSLGAANDGWYAGNRQVEAISAITNLNSTLRMRPRLSANYTPVQWLTNRLIIGADMARTEGRSMYPRNDQTWYGSNALNSGQISEARRHYDIVTVDWLSNATAHISDAVRADISVGAQYITERNDRTNATGTGLITNSAHSVNAAAQLTGGGQSFDEEKSIGVFAQTQFGIFDRLYVQVAGRLDRHSAFGADADLFLSPKVGASYVLSDEPAIRNVLPDLFNTVRVRASFGTTGRSPGSGALQTYNANPFLITNSNIGSGVTPDNPGNSQLKPERGQEVEAGVDLGLFNERLGLEITYFNKVSKDLILERPLAPSAGFSDDPFVNIGELVNKGLEVAANAQLVARQNVGLDWRVAMNTLSNEVTDLGDVEPFGTMNRIEEGQPAYGFVTRRIIGYELDRACPDDPDEICQRAIVTDEVQPLGNLLPSFEGNTSATLSLFNTVRLYAQLDWKNDFWIYNNTDQFRERQFGQGERWIRRNEILTDTERLDRFGPFVTETGEPCAATDPGAEHCDIAAGNVNQAYIEKGDFFRLREVSATITLPRQWAGFLRAQGASLQIAGRNLGLWSEYTGADPEVNTSTSGQSRQEFLTVPAARRLVTRINLQF
jgi:TonB-dependent starch-binding outer membrane protein SusC